MTKKKRRIFLLWQKGSKCHKTQRRRVPGGRSQNAGKPDGLGLQMTPNQVCLTNSKCLIFLKG